MLLFTDKEIQASDIRPNIDNPSNFNVTSETFDRIKIIFSEFQKNSKLEVFYFIRNQADLFKSFYNHFNFT